MVIKNNNKFFSTSIVFLITPILYVIYLLLYDNIIHLNNFDKIIYFFSILGWIEFIFCWYTWFKQTGKKFDLYIIFLILIFLFNYGQCLMWALNIHKPNEIGVVLQYDRFIISQKSIALAQLLTLVFIMCFHTGAMIYAKKTKKINNKKNEYTKKNFDEKKYINRIHKFSKILLLIITPITFYFQLQKMIMSSNYGYMSLYADDYSSGYFSLLTRLFFPCIFSILISGNFKKNDVRLCYSLSIVYFIFSMFIGARGSLVFPGLILLYLYLENSPKKPLKNILIILLGLILLGTATTIMKDARNNGITKSDITNNFKIENNVIVDSMFELGGSFAVQASLIQYGYNNYDYGNTYIFSILGMVSDRVIKVFVPNYIDLNTWFSRHYLNISWGAGFTIVAEALLNFGIYIGPIFMIFLGYVFTKITCVFDNYTLKKKIFSVISFFCLVSVVRNTFPYYVKVWFFTIVIFYGLFILYNTLLNTKYSNIKNDN